MILIFKIMGILMVSLVCYGQQKITDVPATDAAYPAIKRSVEKLIYLRTAINFYLIRVNRKSWPFYWTDWTN